MSRDGHTFSFSNWSQRRRVCSSTTWTRSSWSVAAVTRSHTSSYLIFNVINSFSNWAERCRSCSTSLESLPRRLESNCKANKSQTRLIRWSNVTIELLKVTHLHSNVLCLDEAIDRSIDRTQMISPTESRSSNERSWICFLALSNSNFNVVEYSASSL